MRTKIKNWNGSAAVCIPEKVLASAGLAVGSHVALELRDGAIVIAPVQTSRKRLNLPFTEESLLQGLNTYTAHADEVATPYSFEVGE